MEDTPACPYGNNCPDRPKSPNSAKALLLKPEKRCEDVIARRLNPVETVENAEPEIVRVCPETFTPPCTKK